jgi:hypothetical protein
VRISLDNGLNRIFSNINHEAISRNASWMFHVSFPWLKLEISLGRMTCRYSFVSS